jgi:hypothetical protein
VLLLAPVLERLAGGVERVELIALQLGTELWGERAELDDLQLLAASQVARSASVGLRRAALAAGYRPATAPITNPAAGAAISA